MKTRKLVFLSAALLTCACSANRIAPPKEVASRPPVAAATPNRHIYVTAGGMPSGCYSKLGVVSFVEPYGDSTIDPDHTREASQLRKVAEQKYPGQVDAIIRLRTTQNDVGTMVQVSGEAVHLNKHETMECMERAAAQARDKAAPILAGGIIGTAAGAIAGGLAGATGLGLLGGAATGVTAAGGYEAYKSVKETRAEEAAINSMIQRQRTEITQLREEVARLEGQRCDQQELPAGTCAERQQAIERVSSEAASLSAATQSSTTTAEKATRFQVLNGIQANEEKIKRLQAEVFQLQQQMGQQ
jgi:hypothetical protein